MQRRNLSLDCMSAWNKHSLLNSSELSFFHEKINILTLFNTFHLHFPSRELELLTLNYIGKAHKSKYISELHAAQVTYSPTKFI